MNRSNDIILKPQFIFWIISNLPVFTVLFITVIVSYHFKHYEIAKIIGSSLSLIVLLFLFYKYIDLLICTKWIITKEQIIIKKGVFFKTINYIELYRVYDYEEKKSFIQALVANTNISIHSGDKSHPVLEMCGLKEDNNIIPVIRERVESQRETKQIYEFTNR
ncbi:PH domain-containing protein [Bacteroidales bacterium OttesenSCG-928-B11]|nr:PH domain-containing protein [Bacteroidales bacterium OttesenSCG-928-E04]MDL2312560.1 PH domain-containing protein [Bacteroidales bacterium OttesenSCG-928-B11]MDL2325823.1 PH domain-containing protein [Bacteroidales bacterium OttesenSCG-928-A14]